jgi:hypothetical protein
MKTLHTNKMNAERTSDGKYARYTSLGCYSLIYICADGGVVCADCANTEDYSETHDDPQWRLVQSDIYWEGEPMCCDGCDGEIESSYGPVEANISHHEEI